MPKTTEPNNIDAAVDAKLKEKDFSHKPNTGTVPGEPAQIQINFRATEEERDRWKKAAELLGVSLAELIRDLLAKKASELLECQHEHTLNYPWARICKDCGKRLRG